MGPPGGGRNDISARFLRHLQIISIDDFDENTMLRIFYAISEWHFSKGYEGAFNRLGKVCNVVVRQVSDAASIYTTLFTRHIQIELTMNNNKYSGLLVGPHH